MRPARVIRASIRDADRRLVARHPWLGADDAVALGLFGLAWAWMGLWAALWFGGLASAWLVVPAVALGLSVLHELEHDLIHDLYLGGRPVVQNAVLAAIWLGKASMNPWARGRIHRWHHVVSGQDEDVEERLIGLGLPWGPKRLILTVFSAGSLVVLRDIRRAVVARKKAGFRVPDLQGPLWLRALGLVDVGWTLLPAVGLAGLILGTSWAAPLLVLWVGPNILRHLSIVLLSSSSHYTGIDRADLVQQNQILDHPLFWPFQLFCWNFGATHVLHHFHVQQPFWRRTLVFGELRATLVDNGVPANDLGTFRRANRRLPSVA
jgi:hypothetical protein